MLLQLVKQGDRSIITDVTVRKLELQQFLTVFPDVPSDTLRACVADC